MSFDTDDLNRYEAANHPTDDVSTSGGGASANAITDAALGFIPTMPIPANPSGDLEWYYKEIHMNDSGSENLPAPAWFVRNGLIRPTGAGVFSVVGETGNTDTIRLTFINNSGGAWDTEEIELNEDTPVVSSKSVQADSHVYGEVISGTGPTATLTTATTAIYITRSTQLGLIPAGFGTADSLHQIALEDALDDTISTADRLTAPVGDVSSFAQAFSVATAIQLPGAIDVDFGSYAGIWWKLIRPEDMPAPIEYFQPILRTRTFITP